MLDASLTRLGRLQSDRFNEWTDEEPGRIPYQVRSGPLALLGLNPYAGYYADYASPLMFVISLTTAPRCPRRSPRASFRGTGISRRS